MQDHLQVKLWPVGYVYTHKISTPSINKHCHNLVLLYNMNVTNRLYVWDERDNSPKQANRDPMGAVTIAGDNSSPSSNPIMFPCWGGTMGRNMTMATEVIIKSNYKIIEVGSLHKMAAILQRHDDVMTWKSSPYYWWRESLGLNPPVPTQMANIPKPFIFSL